MNDPLALIYNEGYWRVSEVSPMFNLQYSEVKLKQYASKIVQAVVSRVGGSSDSQFRVLIDNIPNLKYSHEDPNGLRITVKNRSKSNEKEVYVAIFLTWGDGLYIDNKTHLPYMLERGDNNVGIAVKNTLQTVFDCIIMPFDFTQQQLVNFLINFIENDTSRSSDLFVLSYQTPEVDKNKTSFKFELGDVRRIWSSIKNDETDQDKKLYVYEILRNEIRQRYTLDVALLRLCEVVLPKAEVKCGGAVKMKTPEVVNAVFTVLNEITREIHMGLDIQEHEEEEEED